MTIRLLLSASMALAGSALPIQSGAEIGWVSGQLLGAIFDEAEKPQDDLLEGPRRSDQSTPSASLGRPIPWVFGRDRVATTMIWTTGVQEQIIEGGADCKGFGSSSDSSFVARRFTLSAAFAVCRGVQNIVKVIADKKVMVDRTQFPPTPTQAPEFHGRIRYYDGSEDQEQDPLLVEHLGADRTPAFRGLCYFVIEDLPLERFGNRVPLFECIVNPNIDPILPAELVIYDGVDLRDRQAVTSLDRQRMLYGQWEHATWIDLKTKQIIAYRDFDDDISAGVDEGKTGRYGSTGTLLGDVDSEDIVYCGMHFHTAAGGTNLDDNYTWIVMVDRELNYLHSIRAFVFDPPNNGLLRMFPHMIKVYDEQFTPTGRSHWLAVAMGDRQQETAAQLLFNWYRVDHFFDSTTGQFVHRFTAPFGLPDVAFAANIDYRPQLVGLLGTSLTGFLSFNRIQIWMEHDGDGCLWLAARFLEATVLAKILPTHVVEAYNLSDLAGVSEFDIGQVGERFTYVPQDNSFVFVFGGDPENLVKFSLDERTVTKVLTGFNLEAGDEQDSALLAGPAADGRLWLQTGSNSFREFNFITLELITAYSDDDWDELDGPPGLTNRDGTAYDPVNHALIRNNQVGNDTVWWFYLDRFTSGGDITLKEIVDAISDEVTLEPDVDTNASDLAPVLVDGFTLNNRGPARAGLNKLREGYDFDGAEIDYAVKFQRRSSAVKVRTLTSVDLGFGDMEGPLRHVHRHDRQLPFRVEVTYSEEAADFQSNMQETKRGDGVVSSRDRHRVDLPIVLTNQEAKDISERIMYRLYVERDAKIGITSQKNVDLTPMDIVGIVLPDGSTFDVYVANIAIGNDLTVEFESVIEDSELAFLSGQAVGDTDGFVGQQLPFETPVVFEVLDIPTLRARDGDGLHAYKVGGIRVPEGSFPGMVLERSSDGLSFDPWALITQNEGASIGWLESLGGLNDGVAHLTWDRVNTPVVLLYSGSLSSATEKQVLNGANPLVIGGEIVQFVNATLLSDDSRGKRYQLDTLLRGRRGTENEIGRHTAFERVVVLSAATVGTRGYALEDFNLVRVYRGRDLLSGALTLRKSIVLTGASMKPFAPIGIRAGWSGNDVSISWRRRARLNGGVDWIAGPSAPPLIEAQERYDLLLLDQGVEVFSKTVTAASTTITADEQEQAFGSAFIPGVDRFAVRVHQIGDLVGRGFPSCDYMVPNLGV